MSEQEILYNTIVRELEQGKLVLPTLPEVAFKVREVAKNPDASTAELADVITTDAALSARLIKVANSPLYRGRVPIESVHMAVGRLGQDMVRNMVTTLVMEQLFKAKSPKLEKRLRELWKHSTEVAALSRVIASKQKDILPDEALLAGLIHDIGVMPILMKAQDHPEMLEDRKKLDTLISNLHGKIGEAILKKWEFPANLIAVAAEHENLNRNSGPNGPDLVDVVQAANLQSYFNTDKALDPSTRHKVLAFEKLGIDTGISVAELDENSAEYAEALALFENM
ncbi:signal transduction protein [Methylophaga lonarensis MPL]|uniref:Signal transduction protein n=1 Tax=Methylophaga lonarensis MPL TaxID=1286106 RepID=M7PDP0_9GAMM|nr:HDOD domain-containing protein [Methylophaga lonarensis]EMR12020.1 signal transduction protein [Methylophaga lonarensis MPL]